MLFKSLILRLVGGLIAVVMLVAVGVNKTESYDVRDPEHCRLHFSVLSDSHIEGNNTPRYKAFAQSLQNVKKNRSGNDAVVFLGDNTMNGQNIENLLFHGTAALYLRGETILPVIGNHDLGNGNGQGRKLEKRWLDYTAAFFGRQLEHPYYYEVIDGCYFIVLGIEALQDDDETVTTEAQIAWLEDVLAKAAESGKPAFVFSHYPMDYAEDETGLSTDRLVDLLAAYAEAHDVFAFVGHTHMPLHLFWSFHDYDGFPEIYLPRLTELYGSEDREYGSGTGVGIEVEVYENEVLIRGRNFVTGEWYVDTWEDDEPLCEMTYPLQHSFSAQ